MHRGLRGDGLFRYSGQGQNSDETLTAQQRWSIPRIGAPSGVSGVEGPDTMSGASRSLTFLQLGRFPEPARSPERTTGVNLVAVPTRTVSLLLPSSRAGDLSGRVSIVPLHPPPPGNRSTSAIPSAAGTKGDRCDPSLSRVPAAHRFGEWLRARGDDVQVLRLTDDGVTIVPDLYVPAIGQVVEAKKSTARAYVRTAIGQALDYAAVRETSRSRGDPGGPPALPSPQPSMVELCTSTGITVWWPISSGDFREDSGRSRGSTQDPHCGQIWLGPTERAEFGGSDPAQLVVVRARALVRPRPRRLGMWRGRCGRCRHG